MERRDRVSELRSGLHRYRHLLKGGEVDYDIALKVEEIESKIIDEIINNKKIIEILENNDLQVALSRLRDFIAEKARIAAEELGDNIEDVDEALEAFYVGDQEKPGFRSVFIVIQAIARVKSEIFEEKNGQVVNPSPVCPVCGAISRTMVKEEDGRFTMVCPFCGYKWTVSRRKLICPYCGNSDPLSLGIFTGRKSKRLGLAWCQACGMTWRVVLDYTIRVPRLLLPVIAHGAEIYRSMLPTAGGAAIGDPFADA